MSAGAVASSAPNGVSAHGVESATSGSFAHANDPNGVGCPASAGPMSSSGSNAGVDLSGTSAIDTGSSASAQNYAIARNQQDILCLRCLITTREAGTVIGRRGSNIQRIREASNSRVMVSSLVPGVSERILTVTGRCDEVAKAYAQIARILNSWELGGSTPDAIESSPRTARFLIPNSRMGGIIGKGGSRIKDVQSQSNARLAATSTPLPGSTDRLLEITGVPDAIHIATFHVMNTIQEQNSRMTRDAREREYRPEYSLEGQPGPLTPNVGAPTNSSAVHHHHQQQTHSQQHQHGHHRSHHHQDASAHNSGAYVQSFRSGAHLGHQSSSYGASSAAHMMPHGAGQATHMHASMPGSPGGSALQALETRCFMCPHDKVGQMIGRGGGRINLVRHETCCKIVIEDAAEGSADRPFVITGPPHGVEMAMQQLRTLLQRELARENAGSSKNEGSAENDGDLSATTGPSPVSAVSGSRLSAPPGALSPVHGSNVDHYKASHLQQQMAGVSSQTAQQQHQLHQPAFY